MTGETSIETQLRAENDALRQQVNEHDAQIAHFRAFVEGTNDLVTQVAPNGTFTYVNTAVERFLAKPAARCIGLSAFDIIHPDDRERTQEAFRTWIEQRATSASFENRLLNRDGVVMPVLWTINLHYDAHGALAYINSICRDMTQYQQQEAELRRFQDIVAHSPIAISDIMLATGQLAYVNPTYCQLLGYSATELDGKALSDVVDAEPGDVNTILQQCSVQGHWHGELTHRRKDGTTFPAYLFATVRYDRTGAPYSLMSFMRDTTMEQHAEQERQELQQQIIDAQRAALRELSTPLIPITDDVVIMPLVGTVDSQRAQMVMESLLEGAARHQADLVILDITGVSLVDTQVAQAFIQAAQAVQLLGARVMLTGIQPQIAQTLVHLGVDLSSIDTRSSLQTGIAAALNR